MHTEAIEMYTKVFEFEATDKWGTKYAGQCSIVYEVLVTETGIARMFEACLEVYGDDDADSLTVDSEQEAVDEINAMLKQRHIRIVIPRTAYVKLRPTT